MKTLWIPVMLLLLVACQNVPMPHPSALHVINQSAISLSSPALALNTLSIKRPRRGAPPDLFGVNYYPQNTPWQAFWQNYQAQEIQQDLLTVKQLGFNGVRIFVFYQQFGGAVVKRPEHEKLLDFLNQADQTGVDVVVTLFDQFTDYTALESSRQHIQGIVNTLENHPAIAAWDLKNESDLDYPHYGESVVRNWVQVMSQFLQSQVKQPVTASYAHAEKMGPEVESLDYLTFHYYDYESKFAQTVENILQRFPDHPLVLGEFGFHTWEDNASDPHLKAHQFNYFNAILAAAHEHQLAGIMVWNLYDYNPELKGIAMLPVESRNHHLGLLDLKQQPKPGLLALQQSVHAVDAQTGQSLSLRSTEIKVIVRAAQSSPFTLSIKHPDGITQVSQQPLKKGVNRLQFKVSTAQMKKLISLEDQLLVAGDGLVNNANQRQALQQMALILRRR